MMDKIYLVIWNVNGMGAIADRGNRLFSSREAAEQYANENNAFYVMGTRLKVEDMEDRYTVVEVEFVK